MCLRRWDSCDMLSWPPPSPQQRRQPPIAFAASYTPTSRHPDGPHTAQQASRQLPSRIRLPGTWKATGGDAAGKESEEGNRGRGRLILAQCGAAQSVRTRLIWPTLVLVSYPFPPPSPSTKGPPHRFSPFPLPASSLERKSVYLN